MLKKQPLLKMDKCRNFFVHTIVFENFKSYFGKHVLGPFDRKFTAIVGPNGSGKSNILDGILFVLGYGAKRMRQKRVSELIYNAGSVGSVDFCLVEICFREGERKFLVSRRAFRNNKTQYYLDNKASTFSEIRDFLIEKGVDLVHNRFLILQGEVELISQMKAKGNEGTEGLLEYIEDIVGTNRYIEEIKQLEEKMEENVNRVNEKQVCVKIVQKELLSLEPQVKEAERYLELEKTILYNKCFLAYIKIDEYKKKEKETIYGLEQQKNKNHKEELKKKMQQQEIFEKELEEIQRELGVNIEEGKNINKGQKIMEKKQFRCEEVLKAQKNQKCEVSVKKKQKEVKEGLCREKEIKKELEILEEEIRKQQEDLKIETEQLSEIEKRFEGQTRTLKQKLESFRNQRVQKQNEAKQKNTQKQKLTEEVGLIEKLFVSTKTELESLTQKRRENNELVKKHHSDIVLFNEKRKTLEMQLEQKQEECVSLEKEVFFLRQKKTQVVSSLDEKETQRKTNSSIETLLNEFKAEKRRGNFQGLYGRLGDLGHIDRKYDVAISTACSQLNSLVVDTTETGQACIEYLKRKKLGRATFIILNQLRSVTKKPVFPEIHYLVDLVHVHDPALLGAFQYALGSTLVAESVDEASKIAYGKERQRVVTLDGKLFEKSGSISGGGRIVSGGMKLEDKENSSFDIKQVEMLKDSLEKKAREQHQLNSVICKLTQELDGILFERQETQERFRDEQEKKARLEKEQKRLSAQIEKMQQEEIAKVEQMEKRIGEYEKEISVLLEKEQQEKQNEKKIEEQIEQFCGLEYKKKNSCVSECKEKIVMFEDKKQRFVAEKKVLAETLVRKQTELKYEEEENAVFQKKTRETEQLLQETKEKLSVFKDEKNKNDTKQKMLSNKVKEKASEMEQNDMQIRKQQTEAHDQQTQLTRLQTVLDDTQKNLQDEEQLLYQLKTKTPDVDCAITQKMVQKTKKENVEDQLRKTEEQILELCPNISSISEYSERKNEHGVLVSELAEVERSLDETKQKHRTLCKQRLEEFTSGFSQISKKLKEIYQFITETGNAELEWVDCLDPFSEGILFSVMPPKKSWKGIANLSGGEKTLSSLALVFAMHSFRPTPFYIMDEIDAALDYKNVGIVAEYVARRTNAQFIVISLHPNMFEQSLRLVGVYKTKNISQTICIDPMKLGS